ncbi:MAG: fibronectin type III domain-containing protein [Eubacterium sp.]|nr:fibronectin type III domain-containing protein [Eubacterium sp.]
MKNHKSVIAIILAAVIAVSFSACKGNKPSADGAETAVYVTDENGETVTDKDGKAVTEAASEASSEVNLSEKESAVKESKKEEQNKKKNNKDDKSTTEKTTAQPVTKPKNPNSVQKLRVKDITEDGLTLKWKGVTCDYYELEYKHKEDERWESIDDKYKGTSLKIEGLESLTEYSFRIRAIIENKGVPSESAWTYADAKTKEKIITRKIKFEVLLPARGSEKDKLVIKVYQDGKEVEKLEGEVVLDGSAVALETEKEYKGIVRYKAVIKKLNASRSGETDKDVCEIDISEVGINTIIDEDN